ncbi:MAG: hypothetical protein LBS92_04890 [Candidatus Methanoplasma sp.]|jgi:polyphosphate kinase 2 (PPK2 family)|nr:hypothetical protein [Candidatus Methanoplasma sp.]
MDALIDKDLNEKLNRVQQKAYERGIPILILFEGNSGRVIGKVINELMRCLEPRGVEYHRFDPGMPRDPWLVAGFLRDTPANARISLYDRSWYSVIIERHGSGQREDLDGMLDMANNFEAYLANNGTLVIKILLRASESVIKEHGESYGHNQDSCSFLCLDHIDLTEYREIAVDHINEKTDTAHCPWVAINAGEVKDTVRRAAAEIIRIVEKRLDHKPESVPVPFERPFPNARAGIDLSKRCECDYEPAINEASDELACLQERLAGSERSLVVGFEGWDAAGKGSAIKHLCHALNPRGYRVVPIKAPTQDEMDHTYLWRFSNTLPPAGRATIYDRTWYGRMLVERAEGLCTEGEYLRSPKEINDFERVLADNGAIVVKFWMEITQDEQMKRFKKRMKDPMKQWKITDDDWRNRSKWDTYSECIDAVLEATDTAHAPWTVVESNDKKYARLKVLHTVADILRKELH